MEMVKQGLNGMVQDLRCDPQALETVWLSVIAFANGAEQIVPLTEVFKFPVPELAAKGKSDMGAGLRLLVERLDHEVRRGTSTEKGDWKPVAFLLSDGGPSDAWITPAKELRARHEAGKLAMIAVGFGGNIHVEKLERVTPHVLLSESAGPEAFSRFLKWVSVSVTRSVQVGPASGDLVSTSAPPAGFKFHRALWGS